VVYAQAQVPGRAVVDLAPAILTTLHIEWLALPLCNDCGGRYAPSADGACYGCA